MKAYKLKRTEYDKMAEMLRRVGATYGEAAFPQHVYCNNSTYGRIHRAYSRVYIKRFRGASAKRVALSVNMDLLNLGPCTQASGGIRDGWVIVDEVAIGRAIKLLRNTVAI